jgi:O-antigen/teichoic acid export membrane protein
MVGGTTSPGTRGSRLRAAGQLRALAARIRGAGRLKDLSTLPPEGRSRERHKRLALAAATSIGTRSVSIVVGLVTLPVLLRYLGPELYGLWVVLTSFGTLLVFADLGLGQGVVNGIAAAEGENQRRTIASLVASAFYMLVVVAVLIGCIFAVVYPLVPWDDVFNVRSASAAQVAGPAVAVLVTTTLLAVPLGLAVRVRHALQESFVANVWMAAGSVISLTAIVFAIVLDAGLPWLVFAFACGPLSTSLMNSISLLRDRRWLVPRLPDATVATARQLLGLGLLFFVVQVAGVAAYEIDNIIIARIIDTEAVTQFAVPMRLFLLVPTVVGLLAYPLWPASREALARGDESWFRHTVKLWLGLTAAAAAALSVLLALVATPLIHLWAGSDVTPTTSLLVALAGYSTLFSVSIVAAMFLYAVQAVRFVAITSVAFVAVNLVLSIALTRSIGIPGPVWGSVIAMLPSLVVQLAYIRRRLPNLTGLESR